MPRYGTVRVLANITCETPFSDHYSYVPPEYEGTTSANKVAGKLVHLEDEPSRFG